ncbi:uncharacterized protein RJT21DRAFT_119488 [Scheffersomyces amazonensis]|uniref:uncharacterized protein n=1 Tax=Scheffersomyces amazonensis TaxID=1078765 RepID=UPI00315C9528
MSFLGLRSGIMATRGAGFPIINNISTSLRSTSLPSSSIAYLSTSSILKNVTSETSNSSNINNIDLSRVRDFKFRSTKVNIETRKNERVVLWKMYAIFHRHNTLASLVAVVEDLDFIDKNKNLSYNDKVLYYLQLPHHTRLHVSAGQLGFRKAQRAEYEAGFQVATKLFKTIEEKNLIGPNDKIELIFKDFGKGREAFQAALMGKEGQNIRSNIVRLTDNTKLKFGGTRSKKLRRL